MIMKELKVLVVIILFTSCNLKKKEYVINTDISNFWKAYDKVCSTKDSIEQIKYIEKLFISKGTPGLKGIMKARRYDVVSYQKAIIKYPEFWKTLRSKTLKTSSYIKSIEEGVDELKKIYPSLISAKIYFTIGAFKTGGTTIANKVLIGSEIALADKTVNVSELKKEFPHLLNYFKSNTPEKNIVFSCLHEYIHTQQDTTIANSLLARILIEGVAEFVAEKVLNTISPTESVIYGKKNDSILKDVFVKEMFTKYEGMWFWGNSNNQFKKGDLGYYIGYAICKSYYEKAINKEKAIKEMITLNYLDEKKVYQFIDASKYFEKTIDTYIKEFEIQRPYILGIKEFKNNSENIDSNIKTITVEFSEKMNSNIMNLKLGPLGEHNLLEITELLGWSEDRKKITYKVNLQKNLRQQLLITDVFRSEKGYLLKPYLIDITTK